MVKGVLVVKEVRTIACSFVVLMATKLILLLLMSQFDLSLEQLQVLVQMPPFVSKHADLAAEKGLFMESQRAVAPC